MSFYLYPPSCVGELRLQQQWQRQIEAIFLQMIFFPSPHFLWRLCSYPSCSGAKAPGLAADMHFKNDVIAFVGPACAFALEPVARLAAYWNSPIITGMGDQVRCTLGKGLQGKCKSFNASEVFSI